MCHTHGSRRARVYNRQQIERCFSFLLFLPHLSLAITSFDATEKKCCLSQAQAVSFRRTIGRRYVFTHCLI